MSHYCRWIARISMLTHEPPLYQDMPYFATIDCLFFKHFNRFNSCRLVQHIAPACSLKVYKVYQYYVKVTKGSQCITGSKVTTTDPLPALLPRTINDVTKFRLVAYYGSIDSVTFRRNPIRQNANPNPNPKP